LNTASKFGIDPCGISDFKVYVPQSGNSDAKSPLPFKVPISGLDPYMLADLMDLSEPQGRLFEGLTENIKAKTAKGTSNRMGVFASETSSGYKGLYTLQTLINELGDDKSTVIPKGTHSSTIPTLRSKLIKLGLSQMLDWDKTESISELPISDLLVGGRLSILDVSETDDRSRNIAIAYILQSLFDWVIQYGEGVKMPNDIPRPRVLVVIEEVHTFVSRSNASKMRSVLDNMQVISRRGRKRWMSLALVSQQPGHVPDELFELANTRFIHQLKSTSNLAPVKQTTGGVHEALWSTIPSLGPGQCLITGAIFNNPLFVEIRPAKTMRTLIN